jgi:hypothetical protein
MLGRDVGGGGEWGKRRQMTWFICCWKGVYVCGPFGFDRNMTQECGSCWLVGRQDVIGWWHGCGWRWRSYVGLFHDLEGGKPSSDLGRRPEASSSLEPVVLYGG